MRATWLRPRLYKEHLHCASETKQHRKNLTRPAHLGIRSTPIYHPNHRGAKVIVYATATTGAAPRLLRHLLRTGDRPWPAPRVTGPRAIRSGTTRPCPPAAPADAIWSLTTHCRCTCLLRGSRVLTRYSGTVPPPPSLLLEPPLDVGRKSAYSNRVPRTHGHSGHVSQQASFSSVLRNPAAEDERFALLCVVISKSG